MTNTTSKTSESLKREIANWKAQIEANRPLVDALPEQIQDAYGYGDKTLARELEGKLCAAQNAINQACYKLNLLNA
jgi:hypothetical protein